MDEKDRFTQNEKVTPLFRHSERVPDEGERDHDDLIESQGNDAEYASEPDVIDNTYAPADRTPVEDHTVDRGIGWLALVLSAIGLFFLPVVLGTAGVIIGFVALRQGAKTLGGWAISIGVISLILRLFVGPFV